MPIDRFSLIDAFSVPFFHLFRIEINRIDLQKLAKMNETVEETKKKEKQTI
jgi:hypothetical protein